MDEAQELSHRLEREVTIRAPQAVVFSFFTDSVRWARWWGPGSTIDARVGGRVFICYPNGVEAHGEILAIRPPEYLCFTFGYESGVPIPPGASRVEIRLTPNGAATRVQLTHAFDDDRVRDDHQDGWRYQLSVFSNVVADEAHAGATEVIDRWFEAWTEADEARLTQLRRIVAHDVQFRDRYAAIQGVDELLAHIAATRRFMPRVRIERCGTPRQCQGMVLADWRLIMQGAECGRGSSVFSFSPSATIEWVTGFWEVSAAGAT